MHSSTNSLAIVWAPKQETTAPPSRKAVMLAGLAFVLVTLADRTAPLWAQQPNNEMFRESVTLDMNTQAVKMIQSASDLIRERQWDQAIPLLQQLIDNHSDSLVAVETGRYWNVADMCHWLISQLPPASLKTYRERVDGQADLWLNDAKKTRDPAILSRIVRQAFCSSAGDDALWLLGEWAFEHGEFAVARQTWERLVPAFLPDADGGDAAPASHHLVYPDSSYSLAEVRARLILCRVFSDQIGRAQRELAVFAKLHANADGELCGVKGNLVELLTAQIEASRSWNFERPRDGDYHDFGGSPERKQSPGAEQYIGDRKWQLAFPYVNLNVAARLKIDPPLSIFPVIDNGKLFCCDAYRIYAYDLKSGRPAWEMEQINDAPDGKPAGGAQAPVPGEIYNNSLGFPLTPGQSSGVARYTMTISDGILYARMGPPMLRKSRNESTVLSEIVGLDITRSEGALVFQVTSDVLDEAAASPEATKWCFEGTPVVKDGRIYVTARRSTPEDQIVAVCFDRAGQVIWRRQVCVSLLNSPDHFNWIGHRTLTWGDGLLFVNTGTGAIAALDSESGRINWVYTYMPSIELTRERLDNSRRIGVETCLYHDGTVFVAPIDTNEVIALDATTGHEVWKQPDLNIVDLLGVAGEQLIGSGLSLVSLNIRNGIQTWQSPAGNQIAPDSWTHGRAWLTAKYIYRPTQTTIEKLRLADGVPVQRFILREQAGRVQEFGGNLLVSDGLMIVSQAGRIVAFSEELHDPDQPIQKAKDHNPDGKSIPIKPLPNSPPKSEAPSSETSQILVAEPWNSLAKIEHQLYRETQFNRRFELTLEKARVLESRISQTETESSNPQSVSPLARLMRAMAIDVDAINSTPTVVEFHSPQERGLAWAGTPSIVHAANQAWLRLRQLASHDRKLADRVTHKMPLRHQVIQQLKSDLRTPWPIRRQWQMASSKSLSICTPGAANDAVCQDVAAEFHSQFLAPAPIILNSERGELARISASSGRVSWTTRQDSTFQVVGACNGLLILASDMETRGIDAETGRLIWRRFLKDSATVRGAKTPRQRVPKASQFVLLNRGLMFADANRVACLNPNDGSLEWEFDTAQTRRAVTRSKLLSQPPFFRVDNQGALFGPSGTRSFFRLNTDTGVMRANQIVPTTLKGPMNILTRPSEDNWIMVGQSPENRKDVWGISPAGRIWNRPLSGIAHGGPIVLQDESNTVLLEDNIFAVAIDPRTGATRWKAAVFPFPTQAPKLQTQLINGQVVTVAERRVSARRLENGKPSWQRFLDEGNWTMTRVADDVILIDSNDQRSRIVALNGDDGTPIQSVSIAGRLENSGVIATARTVILHSSTMLACYVAVD